MAGIAMFQTTMWSLIQQAGSDSPHGRAALESLCRTYRPAALAYLRAAGYPPEDAEDLVQGFFARMVEKRLHAVADPRRGRFRVFLRVSLRNFVNNQAAADNAQRRHPRAFASETDVEQLAGDDGPERAFERAWNLAVLDRAMQALEAEVRARGRGALFEALRDFLVEAPAADDYARVAAALSMRPNSVAVATHRLRHRLRELVREELLQTVADPADVGEEIDRLLHPQGTGGA